MAWDAERGIYNNEGARENVWEAEGITYVVFLTRDAQILEAQFLSDKLVEIQEPRWEIVNSKSGRILVRSDRV